MAHGGPGDRAAGGQAEPGNADTIEQDDQKSKRAKLRSTLTRRRATGLSRLAMRNWRIRTRLIALLALPVMVALVLGGLRIQTSMEASQQLAQMANLSDLAKKATNLADALQTERDISAGPRTRGGQEDDDEVEASRKNTDDLSRTFTASADKFENLELSGGKALLLQVRKDLNSVADARRDAYTNDQNIQATITSYDVIIKDLLSITQDIALASNNSDLVRATRALQQFSLAKDVTSQQRALISAALANKKGPDLSLSDESFGIRLRGAYDNAIGNFNSIYTSHELDSLREQLSYNSLIADADRYSRSILQQSGIKQTESRSYKDWYDQSSAKITQERRIESRLIEELDGKAQALQSTADTEALITGGLVALVLLVAIAGAAVIARSMVRSLTRLQTAAEDVAERRLPELVKTLSESDPHDVDVTVEPVGVDSTDEIGHVAHAFDMVHSEAVRLAAEQALLRGNINAMFTNLSRRSQGLIQRQLSLISELESREADPDQLASLFKLDHLATRMRRNGENLLVLAGEDPGRRWTRPVPLVDVLRAAASEVEQYERIELASVPSAEVAGRVVNDLVHLLAELLENATSFSSPQTRVRVTGHALPDGRVLIEIHDTGIGLSPDDLADINERLANPPVVDVSVSRRMGLFVVGRLSLRHGIRIQLRPSDSGGTTALVMLPVDVTNSADRRGGRPGGPSKQPRGVGPTPRQRQVPGQGPAAALPQGPGGAPGAPGAPGSRPQLGQGGPGGRPGAPAGAPGGLPTRQAGQSLRENPPTGAPQQGGSGRPGQQPGQQQGQQQGGPGGRPGAPLPRRGQQPEQGNQQQPGARRPAQERPRPGAELPDAGGARPAEQPQHGWADQPTRGGRPDGRQDGPPVRRQPQQAGPQGGPDAGRRPAQGLPQRPLPQGAQAPAPHAQAEPAPVETTAQFARPRFEASEIDPRDPLGLGLVEPVLPTVPNPARPEQVREPARQEQAAQQQVQQQLRQEPMALPTAPSGAAGHGQEQADSRWFREDGRPGGDQQVRTRQYQPQRPGTSAPGFDGQPEPAQQGSPYQAQQQAPQQGQQQRPQQGQQPQGRPAQQGQAPQGQQPGPGDAPWRPSANDERWRRAEQVREPSTNGITLSGLPRRTPQANLVSGTAEQAPLTGPQVSRAPEEVRGRLTNLRRGIQQGRRAGAEQTGPGNPAGTGHGAQQAGFDSFGSRGDGNEAGRNTSFGNGADHQER
ncbi:nitrate- and nitrite sensing domain-containing protein [Kitasatospora sp. NPDC057015]|uniref:nitrate- and nitrite sensing domain-containing protein n=1 Tax=Kitasatospora sp. NPDC057015 TaxID=3346001 RepID=UPI003641020A